MLLDFVVCKKNYEKDKLKYLQNKFIEELPKIFKTNKDAKWTIHMVKIFCNYMNILQHPDFVLNRENTMVKAILDDPSYKGEANIYAHAINRNPRILKVENEELKLKELRSIINGYIKDFENICDTPIKTNVDNNIVLENFTLPSDLRNIVQGLLTKKPPNIVSMKDYPIIRKFLCINLEPFKDSEDILIAIYNAMKTDKEFSQIYTSPRNQTYFAFTGAFPFISTTFIKDLKTKYGALHKLNYNYVKALQQACRDVVCDLTKDSSWKKSEEIQDGFHELDIVETPIVRKAIAKYSPNYNINQALPCDKIRSFLNADLTDIPEKFNSDEISKFLSLPENSRGSLMSSVSRWFIPKEEHQKLKKKHGLSRDGKYSKVYLQEIQKICRDRYMTVKENSIA